MKDTAALGGACSNALLAGRKAELRHVADGAIPYGLVDLVGRGIGKVGVQAARMKALVQQFLRCNVLPLF